MIQCCRLPVGLPAQCTTTKINTQFLYQKKYKDAKLQKCSVWRGGGQCSKARGVIHSGCNPARHCDGTAPHCCHTATFFSPRVGRLLQPALPPPAGSTGQTVSVIPKISYRFSATIPPLFVAFEVRFERLGWAGRRGGWAVTWPPPTASSSFSQSINRLPTDCPIQIQQPTQLTNQRLSGSLLVNYNEQELVKFIA